MEGAALLADELGELLRARGMSQEELDACRALQTQASILPEARLAREAPGVRALHDVTEGGLATALRELAAATGRGVLVHRDRVPVSPETSRICACSTPNPLGLLASGSLLSAATDGGGRFRAALEAAGVPAADIASSRRRRVLALQRDRPAPWPQFSTDEAARLLARSGTPAEEE